MCVYTQSWYIIAVAHWSLATAILIDLLVELIYSVEWFIFIYSIYYYYFYYSYLIYQFWFNYICFSSYIIDSNSFYSSIWQSRLRIGCICGEVISLVHVHTCSQGPMKTTHCLWRFSGRKGHWRLRSVHQDSKVYGSQRGALYLVQAVGNLYGHPPAGQNFSIAFDKCVVEMGYRNTLWDLKLFHK